MINAFADGINLKCGCGQPCRYLQCLMSCCDFAAAKNNGQLKVVMKHKQSILSLIHKNQLTEALDFTYDLLKHNLINEHRFEVFRVKHFSCELR